MILPIKNGMKGEIVDNRIPNNTVDVEIRLKC